MKKQFFLVVLLLAPLYLFAQNKYPVADFKPVTQTDGIVAKEMLYSHSDQSILLKGKGGDVIVDARSDEFKQLPNRRSANKNVRISTLKGSAVSDESGRKINLSDNTIKQPKYSFLTSNDSESFCIVIDSLNESRSYQNHIGRIGRDGKVSVFAYMIGNPVGVCCSNEFLWYLYTAQDSKKTAYLLRYDLNSGIVLDITSVSIVDPVGLVYVKGSLFTYSNGDNNLYKLDIP